MSGILTSKAKSRELLQQYYSQNLLVRNTLQDFESLYCFIARVNSWDNEAIPPTPSNTDQYYKEIYKNMIAIKKLNSNDMIPVIERVDWKSGTTYVSYDQYVDLTELDAEGKLVNKFYVRNNYDQVFKCIYNGKNNLNPNGVASTSQPFIDFSINSDSDIISTADGYKWVYLYTIQYGNKVKFFDDSWMPISVTGNRSKLTAIGAGEISNIDVYNTGNFYTDDNGTGVTTTIEITGDGIGATAVATIANNKVTEIVVTNPGTGYSYATANVVPNATYSGNGAVLLAQVSPIGGHGYDLLSELGCHNIMVTTEFNGTENGSLPNNIDYRQVGLITNPELLVSGESTFANSYIYNLSEEVFVSDGTDLYIQDEIVYQGSSLVDATFKGTVLNFDADNNILYLINTIGTITKNDTIKGQNSNSVRLVINNQTDDFVKFSGSIIYIENRKKVQRSPSGLEQFRLILKY